MLKRFEVTQTRKVIEARILEVYANDEDDAAAITDSQGEPIDPSFIIEQGDWEIIHIEEA